VHIILLVRWYNCVRKKWWYNCENLIKGALKIERETLLKIICFTNMTIITRQRKHYYFFERRGLISFYWSKYVQYNQVAQL